MNNKNNGFSLIELLVVMAIMGIMLGGSMVAFGLIQSGNMMNVANSIETGFQDTRTKTMTQNMAHGFCFSVEQGTSGKVIMRVTKNAAVGGIDTVTELKKCTMTYTDGYGVSCVIGKMSVVFDSSTGAIKQIDYYSSPADSTPIGSQTSGTAVLKLSNNNKESEIQFFFATGKCEVN